MISVGAIQIKVTIFFLFFFCRHQEQAMGMRGGRKREVLKLCDTYPELYCALIGGAIYRSVRQLCSPGYVNRV